MSWSPPSGAGQGGGSCTEGEAGLRVPSLPLHTALPPCPPAGRGLLLLPLPSPHPPRWLITAPSIPHRPVPVLHGGGEGDRGSLCSFPSPASVHLLCEKACLRKLEPVPARYL